MIHIYHHNDADGRLSAAILLLHKSGSIVGAAQDVKLHECSYGPAPDFGDLAECDRVAIVDYSFKDADFERLLARLHFASQVTWIDHHASCKDSKYLHLEGVRSFVDKGPAACQLVWKYCYPNTPEPEIVTLVGDYDSWAMKREPACRQFYEAVKADPALQDPSGWLKILRVSQEVQNEWTSRVICEGDAIIRYRDGYLAGLRKTFGYKAQLEDVRWRPLWTDCDDHWSIPSVPALNVQQFGSAAFTAEQMRDNPFCIAYCHDGNEFTVSLYSEHTDTTDCGAIAKAFGGGGHRGAAGFKCKELPWKRT